MNEQLRMALEALERGAREARAASSRSAAELRDRLERAADEVLTHLEAEPAEAEPEELIGRLDRQARDIADDLRRVERLMKDRLGRE